MADLLSVCHLCLQAGSRAELRAAVRSSDAQLACTKLLQRLGSGFCGPGESSAVFLAALRLCSVFQKETHRLLLTKQNVDAFFQGFLPLGGPAPYASALSALDLAAECIAKHSQELLRPMVSCLSKDGGASKVRALASAIVAAAAAALSHDERGKSSSMQRRADAAARLTAHARLLLGFLRLGGVQAGLVYATCDQLRSRLAAVGVALTGEDTRGGHDATSTSASACFSSQPFLVTQLPPSTATQGASDDNDDDDAMADLETWLMRLASFGLLTRSALGDPSGLSSPHPASASSSPPAPAVPAADETRFHTGVALSSLTASKHAQHQEPPQALADGDEDGDVSRVLASAPFPFLQATQAAAANTCTSHVRAGHRGRHRSYVDPYGTPGGGGPEFRSAFKRSVATPASAGNSPPALPLAASNLFEAAASSAAGESGVGYGATYFGMSGDRGSSFIASAQQPSARSAGRESDRFEREEAEDDNEGSGLFSGRASGPASGYYSVYDRQQLQLLEMQGRTQLQPDVDEDQQHEHAQAAKDDDGELYSSYQRRSLGGSIAASQHTDATSISRSLAVSAAATSQIRAGVVRQQAQRSRRARISIGLSQEEGEDEEDDETDADAEGGVGATNAPEETAHKLTSTAARASRVRFAVQASQSPYSSPPPVAASRETPGPRIATAAAATRSTAQDSRPPVEVLASTSQSNGSARRRLSLNPYGSFGQADYGNTTGHLHFLDRDMEAAASQRYEAASVGQSAASQPLDSVSFFAGDGGSDDARPLDLGDLDDDTASRAAVAPAGERRVQLLPLAPNEGQPQAYAAASNPNGPRSAMKGGRARALSLGRSDYSRLSWAGEAETQGDAATNTADSEDDERECPTPSRAPAAGAAASTQGTSRARGDEAVHELAASLAASGLSEAGRALQSPSARRRRIEAPEERAARAPPPSEASKPQSGVKKRRHVNIFSLDDDDGDEDEGHSGSSTPLLQPQVPSSYRGSQANRRSSAPLSAGTRGEARRWVEREIERPVVHRRLQPAESDSPLVGEQQGIDSEEDGCEAFEKPSALPTQSQVRRSQDGKVNSFYEAEEHGYAGFWDSVGGHDGADVPVPVAALDEDEVEQEQGHEQGSPQRSHSASFIPDSLCEDLSATGSAAPRLRRVGVAKVGSSILKPAQWLDPRAEAAAARERAQQLLLEKAEAKQAKRKAAKPKGAAPQGARLTRGAAPGRLQQAPTESEEEEDEWNRDIDIDDGPSDGNPAPQQAKKPQPRGKASNRIVAPSSTMAGAAPAPAPARAVMRQASGEILAASSGDAAAVNIAPPADQRPALPSVKFKGGLSLIRRGPGEIKPPIPPAASSSVTRQHAAPSSSAVVKAAAPRAKLRQSAITEFAAPGSSSSSSSSAASLGAVLLESSRTNPQAAPKVSKPKVLKKGFVVDGSFRDDDDDDGSNAAGANSGGARAATGKENRAVATESSSLEVAGSVASVPAVAKASVPPPIAQAPRQAPLQKFFGGAKAKAATGTTALQRQLEGLW